MPALQPVPHVARIVFNGLLASQPCINVMHVLVGHDFIIQTDVNALATGCRTAYVSRFLPLMSSSYTLGIVTATSLESELGPTASAVGSSVGGTVAGTDLSSNAALCLSWAIARHYRGGHPRQYFAGIRSTALANPNSFTAGTVTSWSTAGNSFLTDIAAITAPGATAFALCCVHRKKNKVDLIPPTVDVITSGAADTRVDSMRRRLGKDR